METNTKKGLDEISGKGIDNKAFLRISAWAGAIGPILFTFLIAVESLLRPEYSQVSNYVSDLGVGPYAIIQNMNLILVGFLSIVFAFAFGRTLAAAHGRRPRIMTGVIAIFGLGTIFAGVSLLFLAYFVHILATFIAFLAVIVVQLLIWASLKTSDSKTWRGYRKYSLISGLLSLVLLLVFIYSMSATYHGTTERALIAPSLIWLVITGMKLETQARTEHTQPGTLAERVR